MPIEEPWDAGGLWAAVRPLTEWPQANEESMARLGQDWTNAGLDGLHSGQPSLAGLTSWSDDTGQGYQAQAAALKTRSGEVSELMKRLGWLAARYGEDVAYTKSAITDVINANSGWYFRSTFPLTSWAYEADTPQRIVTTLASSINAFIDAMADRIAARGATGADLPRPEFVPSELPDQPMGADAAVPGNPRRVDDPDRKVGESLTSVEDVMANPQVLSGKLPAEVEAILRGTPGWRVESLGKGGHKGEGWVFRQYNERGNPTGPQLRWHPGDGHHGPEPYWRVVGPNGDLGGIIR